MLLYNKLKNSKLVVFYRVPREVVDLVLIIKSTGLADSRDLENSYYNR